MHYRQNAVFDALQRAHVFFDENGILLTGVVDLSSARRRLEEVLASFRTHALDQDLGDRVARGETSKQRQLRLQLRHLQMAPIARIARQNLSNTPEFAALRMPKPTVFGPAFIASARGLAEAAVVHQETLVVHGLPSNFHDVLQAAIAKLEESHSEREKNRARRVGATKGLDVEEKQGRTILSVLDALMHQALSDNPTLMRSWEGARHIRRRTGPASRTPTTPTIVASAATPQLVKEVTPAAAA